MSRGSQGSHHSMEESEGEDLRSPSAVGEGSMMEMFRLLMEEQRKVDLGRERERRREEERREAEKEEKAMEAAREQHARLLELAEKGKEAEKLKEERQIAYEARQLEQQMVILRAQVELGEKANKTHRDGQDQVLASIAEWKEGEDLEEFFLTAERRMRAAEIRDEEWMGVVDAKLKGKMSTAWQDATATAGDYREAKGKLLKICGYTPKLAADAFYGFKTDQSRGWTADQLYHRGQQLLRRMLAPHRVAEEAEYAMLKGWVGTVVSKRARAALDTRVLDNAADLIGALQDFLALEGDKAEGQAATFKRSGWEVKERPEGETQCLYLL